MKLSIGQTCVRGSDMFLTGTVYSMLMPMPFQKKTMVLVPYHITSFEGARARTVRTAPVSSSADAIPIQETVEGPIDNRTRQTGSPIGFIL